jgi:ABC-type dipeptide/oligopeptide/nickel transport system permease component
VVEYIVRRLIQTVLTLFVLTLTVFFMVRLVPGDPARALLQPGAPQDQVEAMRKLLHLSGPLYVQYATWVWRTVHGDLGMSIFHRQPVSELIVQRLPRTIELAAVAMVFSVVVGGALGLAAALKPGSAVDYIVRVLSLVGFAMPSFWFAIMLILVFSVMWHVLPTSGYGAPKFFVLPVLTLGAQLVGVIASMVSATVSEVMREEFVRTARAKGLRERVVVHRHVLKNAFITLVTLLGLQLGGLLGGAVIVETVFAWPGIGLLTIDAVNTRDYPLVQALALLAGVIFLGINLLVDLFYAVIDPRIRIS